MTHPTNVLLLHQDEAEAEFHKTLSLTKAVNDSVFSKLDKVSAKNKPKEVTAVTSPKNNYE